MILMLQILVRMGSVGALVTLMACGQQGPLYLPQTEGQAPASLPQTLLPSPGTNDIAAPALAPSSGAKPAVPSTVQ